MGCYENFDSNLLRSLPDTELISASMLTGDSLIVVGN